MKIQCPKHGEQETYEVPRSDMLWAANKRVCGLCYLDRLIRRAAR